MPEQILTPSWGYTDPDMLDDWGQAVGVELASKYQEGKDNYSHDVKTYPVAEGFNDALDVVAYFASTHRLVKMLVGALEEVHDYLSEPDRMTADLTPIREVVDCALAEVPDFDTVAKGRSHFVPFPL